MKNSCLILFAIFALALLAGCRKNEEPPSMKPPQEIAFRTGTWFVHGKDTATYYFFDSDGISGRTVSLENGTGVGFTYSVKDSEAAFHMGAADVAVKGVLTRTDDSNVTVKWENGQEETMRFVSDKGSDEFQFYTNEELCKMAMAYYSHISGVKKMQAAADAEPETVTVQIYENIGDHNSTYAWYQIDRMSGKGIDANSGAEVDFSATNQPEGILVP